MPSRSPLLPFPPFGCAPPPDAISLVGDLDGALNTKYSSVHLRERPNRQLPSFESERFTVNGRAANNFPD